VTKAVPGEIRETRLVGVIRADDADQALRIAEAAIDGGIAVIELTFTVPQVARAIGTLRAGGRRARVGAGTVLDASAARMAIRAGAEFLVSPSVEDDVADAAAAAGVPYVPGAATPTEVRRAMRLGADIIKVFPADTLGPRFLRSLLGPFPGLSLMPTGGITPENLGEWFASGAVAVGTGSGLTAPARKGDYDAVRAMACRYVDAVRGACP
jgi:2-dehydro-3-deoxyphosphogluconate aldolase / (4S)-4-hydroxy-2-oxoglutarate aldolase